MNACLNQTIKIANQRNVEVVDTPKYSLARTTLRSLPSRGFQRLLHEKRGFDFPAARKKQLGRRFDPCGPAGERSNIRSKQYKKKKK
ncbi:hypothetical protein TSAR_012793 [Trichomalopsis sarcophagae]|uniref:Uncharacterized protein n=1 Tax=Trichomalopsis sarcophagae TaxID=543379 RepID=A0A232EI65_9HYME|nr:hypothetical protein TSAR_012793 [Trichomalopsis sarcophagae]